jgi:hypothetical protein
MMASLRIVHAATYAALLSAFAGAPALAEVNECVSTMAGPPSPR